MNREQLIALLERFERGEVSRDDLLEQLAQLPFQALGDARIDTHRALRQGAPEVVFGEGKSAALLQRIFQRLLDAGHAVLATRVGAEKASELAARFQRRDHPPGAQHLLDGDEALEVGKG